MVDQTDECRYPNCTTSRGHQDRDDYNARLYCSIQCETKHEHVKADARDSMRSEPADFGHGESTGVQDL